MGHAEGRVVSGYDEDRWIDGKVGEWLFLLLLLLLLLFLLLLRSLGLLNCYKRPLRLISSSRF